MLNRSVFLPFCTFAASFCLAFTAPAVAQEGGAADESEEVIEEIITTGSRIRRADYDGPQPVVVFDRVYLEATGFRDVGDFSRYLPQSHQTLNESVGQYYTGVPEASQFNLRGLGADSTLTLVNGLRVAPYGQSIGGDPFTDVSAIPMSAIERIEILKDGASAIYGADAVAGVVNIILRKDFVGTEASAGYQVTSRGDNAEWNVDLFHGGQRGDFYYMLGMFYQDREPLYNRDRWHSADPDYRSIGGVNFRSGNGSPGTIALYETFTFHADPACGTDPRIANVETWPDYPGESMCTFNYNHFDMMYVDRQRASMSVKTGYEFGNGVHLFTDLLYSHKDSFDEVAPTPVAGTWLDTQFGRPYVPADHPNNPWGAEGEIWYRVLDSGTRQTERTSDQYRVTVGVEGSAGEWTWNGSALDSANSVRSQQPGSVFLPAFGTGQPCFDQVPDQYYNPFGWMPENDPAVVDGFTMTTEDGSDSIERAVDITASRTFGSLPGGPIGIAVGTQWRYQELEEFADEVSAQGLIAGRSADFLLDHADREIRAAYAELSLPVVDSLELQLAARFENYSDFGDTTTPKIAMRWAPLDQLALRASWGTSFHAPDFLDLYQNPVQYLGRFFDTPRCEATDLQADCDTPVIIDVLDQGNRLLGPETGESWYGGIIWRPPFVQDLNVDIGYWRIDYEDKIYWVGGQFVLDNLPTENSYVERAPQTPDEVAAGIPGRILSLTVTPQNLAKQFTDGWDVGISWQRQTDGGNVFGLRLDYTYTATWDAILPEDFGYMEYTEAGGYWDGPIPRNRGNLNLNWQTGRHDLNGTVHYSGHYQNWMEFLPVDGLESDIPFIVDSFATLDLQYAMHFDVWEEAVLRVGCQNCTDEDPPFTHDTGGENIHDRRGLIWYANWTQTF